VSKKVTFLLVGGYDTNEWGRAKSTKHEAALELVAKGHSIQILTEAEFEAMLKNQFSY
jgi:hypothetical protein